MIKLLIVDDEKLLRQGFIHMTDWSSHGYDVVGEAANGEEALPLIESEKPDIVVTDIRMPGMDGIDLIRAVKAAHPQIEIIVLSSYSDFPYVKESLQSGAADYLLKASMSFNDVLASLEKATRRLPLSAAPDRDDAAAAAAYSPAIKAVVDYLRQRYADPGLSLSEAAKKFHFNKSYLSLVFKQQVGVNFQPYLTGIRIDKAKELLMQNKPVNEVCLCVGIDNVSYFSQLFKRKTGVSPSDYVRACMTADE